MTINENLFSVVENKNLEGLLEALNQGADVGARDEMGRTALHYVALKTSETCIMALTEKGSDINAKDNYGFTALLYAAAQGNFACLKALANLGANINACCMIGYTALHSCC